MAPTYPTTIRTFATRAAGDTIQPAHVNDLQDEVTAIETALLDGFAHDLLVGIDNTYDLGTSAARWRTIYAGTLDLEGAITSAGPLTITAGPITVAGVGIIGANGKIPDLSPAYFAAGVTALASYTPTWTAPTNPAIGNGSLAGYWHRMGKLVFLRMFLQIGSTTTLGVGGWTFSLPTTATLPLAAIVGGSALMSHGGAYTIGSIYVSGPNTLIIIPHNGSGALSSTTPFAWVATDFVTIEAWYVEP